MKMGSNPEMWKKLMVLGEKQGAIRLSEIAEQMELGPEETLAFLRQVFPDGKGIEIYTKDSECWVDLNGEAVQYMLPLSPLEWVELYQIMSSVKAVESKASYSLRKKITDNGPVKVVMELMSQIEQWDQEMNESEQERVHQLDQAISQKVLVHLTTKDDKSFTIHPCKVLHLEGQLCLIAEDSQDHCLTVMPLKEVKELESIESLKGPQVTAYEIEEFVAAIRALNEKETRLILKIHDPSSVNLFPDHQFLGKPCMITNPNGDLIWAAYVEPCEALFEWLLTLGKDVEILDPVSFKNEYITYCEERLRKIA